MPMDKYRIVLADDHVLMRDGIKQLIGTVAGLEVIGEAGDGVVLLNLLKKLKPHLVVLDIAMPGMRGIEAAREIRSLYPEIDILFLSMHKSREFLSLALAAGAKGYLLKEDSATELISAIREIRSGRTYLSARLIEQFPTEILGICRGNFKVTADPLTQREREVLTLIAEGNTDRQISNLLYISHKTVQRHRYNIRQKLNIKRTADLVKYAIVHGYISAPI
jgi:DNA-binding NarL/FixJ family response regulator